MNSLSIHTMKKAVEGRGGDSGLSGRNPESFLTPSLILCATSFLSCQQSGRLYGMVSFFILSTTIGYQNHDIRPTWSLRHRIIQIYQFSGANIQAQEEECLIQGLIAIRKLSSEDHQIAEACL